MALRSSSVSPGRPTMKYIFRLEMPQAWAVSTASRMRWFGIGFLSFVRSSSEPVSGAMVTDRAPEAARGRENLGNHRRDPERGQRDVESELAALGENSGQLGMIADRGGDESDSIGDLREPPDAVEDGIGRVAAKLAVVVAHPAIAAFFRASAGHFDQTPVAVLGVRSDHV